MDIDSHEKHIRSLLAFKAWAEPILLALQENEALVAGEAEEATSEQPAENEQQAPEPAVDTPAPVVDEQPSEPSAPEGSEQAPQVAVVEADVPEIAQDAPLVSEQPAASAAV